MSIAKQRGLDFKKGDELTFIGRPGVFVVTSARKTKDRVDLLLLPRDGSVLKNFTVKVKVDGESRRG